MNWSANEFECGSLGLYYMCLCPMCDSDFVVLCNRQIMYWVASPEEDSDVQNWCGA